MPLIIPPDRYRVLMFTSEHGPDRPLTVRRDVIAAEAFLVFLSYTFAAEGAEGYVTRLVITDSPDDAVMVANFDWRYGQGIVFPDRETLEKLKNGKA